MPDRERLAGTWTHSHEEDHDDIQVFRTADFAFPPSRGRSSLTLRPDRSAAAGSPGPDDRGVSTDDGTWELEGDVLTVRCPGWTAQYQLVAAEPGRLELRPVNT